MASAMQFQSMKKWKVYMILRNNLLLWPLSMNKRLRLLKAAHELRRIMSYLMSRCGYPGGSMMQQGPPLSKELLL
ncbi:conserved hypothetical protein [Ricinus communis]|uniref:Uncharacterized protein n=1 Tax=Ricinus communis TaxID=3988 RepID=B9RYZ4_RICCO|nr:conserved hypothetical protein [Ricinus communis]